MAAVREDAIQYRQRLLHLRLRSRSDRGVPLLLRQEEAMQMDHGQRVLKIGQRPRAPLPDLGFLSERCRRQRRRCSVAIFPRQIEIDGQRFGQCEPVIFDGWEPARRVDLQEGRSLKVRDPRDVLEFQFELLCHPQHPRSARARCPIDFQTRHPVIHP
jgi:hypothetical protein